MGQFHGARYRSSYRRSFPHARISKKRKAALKALTVTSLISAISACLSDGPSRLECGPCEDKGIVCGRGPSMRRVSTTSGDYCIDATEVTVAQYASFVRSATTSDVTRDVRCSKSDFTPVEACLAGVVPKGDEPVRCVDWCDAVAFCAWAGKQLCGAMGGGPGALGDIPRGQWLSACSPEGHAFPYGEDYQAGLCRDRAQSERAEPTMVGACSGTGEAEGLFDMSGNVSEWEDACDDATAVCQTRGGSYLDDGPTSRAETHTSYLACRTIRPVARSDARLDLGFRCCTKS